MKETYNREEALFDEAVQLATPEARAAFLAEACAGDAMLRQRVEVRLQTHNEVKTAWESLLPMSESVTESHACAPRNETGDRIGHYKLLQQIGEGGWGVVYLAEQEVPIRRRVALKVIKLGMDTRAVIARFEAERQALAMMNHPNIARVLDAGATDSGRPYFVMELVHGLPITTYCDHNHLSTLKRLELFTQVCHAVQHAHQKGIIHRDLKPSNILVTLCDGVPVPKVIDFGIAKAANHQRLTDKTVFTAFHQFIGTPAYMSPEQAEFSGLDVDFRSDIYSLGVLLYELLTGRPPFETKTLLKSGLVEMRRMIREQEPAKPSTRLRTLDITDLTTVAKQRQVEPPKLINLVRGDLDWIVMKCLEKDQTRRYESSKSLAEDLKRYLNNEPIRAHAPSVSNRLSKLFARHRGALKVASSSFLLAMMLFLCVFLLRPPPPPPKYSLSESWCTPRGYGIALAGDVDGDGQLELVAGDGTGFTVFNGQGKEVDSVKNVGCLTLVADMNGDGRAECFASEKVRGGITRCIAHSAEGNVIQTFSVTGGSNVTLNPLQVRDLDNDGHLEVITALFSGYGRGLRGVVVFDAHTGQEIGRTEIGPIVQERPYIGPVAGESRERIIFGGFGSANGNIGGDDSKDSSSYVWCLDSRGTVAWRKGPFASGGFYDCDAIVPEGKVDSRRNIVISLRQHGSRDWEGRAGQLMMLDVSDGRPQQGFVRDFHMPVRVLAAAHFIPDAEMAILVANEDASQKKYFIRVLRMEPGFPDWKVRDFGSIMPNVAFVQDLDGDGKPEIALMAGTELQILSNDLRPLCSWSRKGGKDFRITSATAAYLGDHEEMDIIVSSGNSRDTDRTDVLRLSAISR